MTGFGRSITELPLGRVTVEIRSLNHRYLEVGCKLPRDLMWAEAAIRNLARKRLARGKVEIYVGVEASSLEISVDLDRARLIADSLQPLASELGDEVTLDHILAVGDITGSVRQEEDEEVAVQVMDAVGEAFDRLVEHRLTEGRKLADDIASRILVLRELHGDLEPAGREAAARGRQILEDYLAELDLKEAVDEQRLEAEIAILAQKADVSEEITRLGIHLEEMDKILAEGGAAGRKMDFLIQEINREINTIGSKAQLAGAAATVVDFKAELEKIREQVQNIE
jgi:uncharacterized protein (TIGR00255 family)